MSAPDSFDARAFDRRYEDLAKLPASLHAEAINNTHGDLLARARGILQWRDALLAGRLPPPSAVAWPAQSLAESLVKEFLNLGVARFCKGQPDLVDALLLDILRASNEYGALFREAQRRHEAELERLEKLKRLRPQLPREKRELEQGEQGPPGGSKGAAATGMGHGDGLLHEASDVRLDQSAIARIRAEAQKMAEHEASGGAAAAVPKKWAEMVRLWSDLAELFGDLTDLLGRGWDLTQGLLAITGWQEVARLRGLLEKAPQLQDIIRQLGRLQVGKDGADSASEKVFAPIRRIGDVLVPVVTPLAPSETRGVERSDELTRMLPSEAVLLTKPLLKRLWHAKRAERALLTYKVEGVLPEHIQAEGDAYGEESREIKRPAERGPLMICVDTSGSMQGTPETVAKALALEAARVAFVEKRACHLYLFGGPKQVKEQTLSLSVEGLGDLLAFLTSSFNSGTDITWPLRRAVERLEKEGWAQADLLMVTDGEFPIEQQVVSTMKRAKEAKGLRSHVVLIGSRDTERQRELFDFVHVFTDWAAVGGQS